jgi:hypothetical protein
MKRSGKLGDRPRRKKPSPRARRPKRGSPEAILSTVGQWAGDMAELRALTDEVQRLRDEEVNGACLN